MEIGQSLESKGFIGKVSTLNDLRAGRLAVGIAAACHCLWRPRSPQGQLGVPGSDRYSPQVVKERRDPQWADTIRVGF